MLSLIGLILTLLGGLVVLIPNRPFLYDLIHHIPPFSGLRRAERRLFDQNEKLTQGDVCFNMMEEAVLQSSQPYDSSGEFGRFRDYGAEFSTGDETAHIDFDRCRLLSIEKVGEDFLSDSDFRIQMVPEEPNDAVQSLMETNEDEITLVETEIPNGRFPEMVREYKRGILSKWGMILLFSGFIMGASGILLNGIR